MNIEIKQSNKDYITFGDVKPNTIFKISGRIFMKLPKEITLCEEVQSTSDRKDWFCSETHVRTVNAIELDTGKLIYFYAYEQAILPKKHLLTVEFE